MTALPFLDERLKNYMYLLYNSEILPEGNWRPTADNRAFRYGDGLFETIRYEQGHIWFWSDHIDRLRRGMQALRLNARPDSGPEALKQQIHTLLAMNGLGNQPARIKLQVWRQPGGLYTPATHQSDYLLTIAPGRPFAVTARNRLGLFDSFRLSPSPISAFKTLNALPYVLTGIYKQEHPLDDVMLLDTAGHLAECNASNLFWVRAETIYTPSLDTGCIAGIVRRQLLRRAPEYSISVEEGLFTPDLLAQAELVFCSNAAGIQWFRQIESDGNTFLLQSSEQALARLAPLLATLMP